MAQTAYQQDPNPAIEGMVADSGPTDIITGLASAAIPFGHFVTHDVGEADNVVRLPAATGEVTGGGRRGIALADVMIESADGTGTGWAAEDAVPILREGRCWVISEDAVATIGVQAFVRFTGGNEGAFRTDIDGGDAVALQGATFQGTCGAGGFVIVELKPQTA